MQSHIAKIAQQNVDITEDEGGVEVIQIHVGLLKVLCNRDNHVII